ncbi:hypothetical protein [Clostridium thailandense]|uniref:hypothetical protein n=1 Tax=Clostridium thailandense TaxID=2794346 RepID=UPI0039892262
MIRIIKRLPAGRVTAAIAFLLLQVFCAIYLPYLAADMVNNGVVKGDIAHIWHQGSLMIALTMLGLVGQVLNPYISAKIAFWRLYKDSYCSRYHYEFLYAADYSAS